MNLILVTCFMKGEPSSLFGHCCESKVRDAGRQYLHSSRFEVETLLSREKELERIGEDLMWSSKREVNPVKNAWIERKGGRPNNMINIKGIQKGKNPMPSLK